MGHRSHQKVPAFWFFCAVGRISWAHSSVQEPANDNTARTLAHMRWHSVAPLWISGGIGSKGLGDHLKTGHLILRKVFVLAFSGVAGRNPRAGCGVVVEAPTA